MTSGTAHSSRVHAVVVGTGAGLDETLASVHSATGVATTAHNVPGLLSAAGSGWPTGNEETDWLLFIAAGVVLEPDTIAALIAAADEAGAGIAGPKLVDARDPEVLLEVGLAADRFGVPFTSVDPGEVDHGQHDGTREVLFVPTECLLIRTELYARLGGFDPLLGRDGHELDLCWRARVVGGPVVVVPDARARVSPAVLRPPGRAAARNRLRTVLKSYSFFRLIWTLIQLAALGAVEMGALVLARRTQDARLVPAAWWWNVRHLPSALRLRWRTQRRRKENDSAVARLQVSGSRRIREYLEARLEAREAEWLDAEGGGEGLADDLRRAITAREVLFWIATAVAVLIGTRALLAGSVPEGGQMLARTPDLGALSAYLASWRTDAFGSPGGGPVHLVLFAVLRIFTLGSGTGAMRLLLVGGYLLGVAGIWRVMARIEPWPAPPVAVAVYALSPVLLGATELFDLGTFWMWCLAPVMFSIAIDLIDGQRRVVPSLVAGAITVAIAATLYPPAPIAYIGLTFAVFAGCLLTGQRVRALVSLAGAVLASLLAVALLAPWSLEVLGIAGAEPIWRDLYTRWSDLRVAIGAGEALRLQLGSAGAGILGAVPAAAAVLALVLARRARLRWAVRLWFVLLMAGGLLFLAGQDILPAAPRLLGGAAAVAGVAVACLCGIGAAAVARDLGDHPLGWRHAAAAAAGLALIAWSVPGVGRIARAGRLGLGTDQVRPATVFLSESDASRVLWIGRAASLPGDGHPLTNQSGSYLLTRGLPSMGDIHPAAKGPGDQGVEAALDQIRAGATRRGGRLLAPFAIRFVIVVAIERPAKVDGPPPDPNLIQALSQQLDLAERKIDPRMRVFENTSALPGPALITDLPARSLAARSGRELFDGLQTTDLSTAARVLERGADGGYEGNLGGATGLLFIPESADPNWTATVGDAHLGYARLFGWAQGYEVVQPLAGGTVLTPSGATLRRLAITGQVVLWGLMWWLRRRRRESDSEDEGDIAGEALEAAA